MQAARKRCTVTYAMFLAAFVVLPTAGVALVARRRYRPSDWAAVALTSAIALVSAFPWDSVAVHRGYWHFAPERILGLHLGVLPVEEVSFFALETWLVAAVTLALLRRER
jgi:lycopene cyclase domain-containing protein